MILSFSDTLSGMGNVASIIISVSLMLFGGFLMTRITKPLKLPNVTAYIVMGILLGPYCFNMIPQNVISGMDFLPDIALAFIAFSTGEFFKLETLKSNGLKVIIIAVIESLLTSCLIFILMFFVLKIDLGFSLVLASISSVSGPTSTMMTIRQVKAKGDFVNTLLLVIAVDIIIALLFFSVSLSIASSIQNGESINIFSILKPTLINLGVLILGGLFGFILKIMMPSKRTTDNKLIIGIAMLFLFCGICALADVSPLLGCMSMGMVYYNLVKDDKFFKQMNYFSPPFLLLYFVRSGLNFKLDSLFASQSVGAISLVLISLLYFIVRIIGKYGGSFVGSMVVKKDKKVRNYLGLAMIPHAGVAIGLAALGARQLGGEIGGNFETIILSSSILYEIFGPALAKLALYKSKSYSTSLDDLVEVEEKTESGIAKTEVEILIEKIKQIQETMPVHQEINEDEEAFTEGYNEEYQNPYQRNNRFRNRRKY